MSWVDAKGVTLMTTVPLTDCCAILGIDPKTLRHWRTLAQMPLHVHPTDARIKCLTTEQVQQLAAVHARPIQLPQALAPSPLGGSSPLPADDVPTDSGLALVQTPHGQAEMDLLKQLSHLETHVSTLQQQLAQLALELLQERTLRYEQRLQTLEAFLQPTQRPEALPQAPQTTGTQTQQENVTGKERCLHPAELRARSRVLPLIEYGAGGTYVVICPQEGELHLTPDSPEWFDWLATLSSFRFIGKQGRLSAYRKGRLSRRWSAYRTIHQHDYQHYLGTTDHLTIDCLEQMAAKLQSHMRSL
jgi:hypothetical protein